MLTVDDRCTVRTCGDKNIYRMIGKCLNCGAGDLLMLFTEGHETRNGRCPVCGCDKVSPSRLATKDETPEA